MPTIVKNSTGRDGSARLRSQGGRPVFEETYTYLVKADYVDQTRAEILATTSGLPVVNVTVGPYGLTVCKGLNAVRRPEATLYWDVTADFSSEVEEGGGNPDPRSDPVAWVPVYETKFERIDRVVTKDRSDNQVVNTAGQAFEMGLVITRHVPIWEFYQFEPATVSDEQVIARSETVNSTTFKGRAEKTLLCVVLSSVIGFYYGRRLRLTQYQIKYNSENWKHKRLSVGNMHRNAAGDELVPYWDSPSENFIILGALDEDGYPAGGFVSGDYALNEHTAKPFVVSFDIYEPVEFRNFLRI